MNEHLFENRTINDIPTVAVFLNGREAALPSGAMPGRISNLTVPAGLTHDHEHAHGK
jgi:hypothetical protein